MLGYNAEQFHQYFNRAWIIDPTDGTRKQVAQVIDNSVLLISPKGESCKVPLDTFTWEHVAIPKSLGYRNCGKHLYFFTMKVARITHKAISDRTTAVFLVPQIEYNMGILDLRQQETYRRNAQMNADNVACLLNPKFLSLKEAVDGLENGNNDQYGFALSPNTAVVLSNSSDSNFDLLFQKAVVASSLNGEEWQVKSPYLTDAVSRSIGNLKYVN